MPRCGSQIVLCDLPVRFDTYKGCTHACSYCFAQKKRDITKIEFDESLASLKRFVEGKRTTETNWCDWDIPLHWGGMSDPFQPAEKLHKKSLECLKYLAETQYPFVFSTKGKLITEPEYLEVLSECNAVAQVSMVSPKYDRLELGAPTFNERLEMLPKLAAVTKRLIVRISPYSLGLADEVASYMPLYKEAGVYGVEIEGMKRSKKYNGFVKVGGDYCYPVDLLRKDFEIIKNAAKEAGLAFYVGENRLRNMGEDTCCCGVVGVAGFKPNKANLNAYLKDGNIEYTDLMKTNKTTSVFVNGFMQKQSLALTAKQKSYSDLMELAARSKTFLEIMGVI